MPLLEACNKIEKVHLYKFSIEKELEQLKITGDFSGSSIHEFLNSLSFLFDVETSLRERYIVVSKLKS
jgi:ferric-dicitrate binding protein FerR (iron transport regulator)